MKKIIVIGSITYLSLWWLSKTFNVDSTPFLLIGTFAITGLLYILIEVYKDLSELNDDIEYLEGISKKDMGDLYSPDIKQHKARDCNRWDLQVGHLVEVVKGEHTGHRGEVLSIPNDYKIQVEGLSELLVSQTVQVYSHTKYPHWPPG